MFASGGAIGIGGGGVIVGCITTDGWTIGKTSANGEFLKGDGNGNIFMLIIKPEIVGNQHAW